MDVLSLSRKHFTNNSTVGELFLDGDFFCHTLEDTCRRKKVARKTAIPAGRYRVAILPSPRYGRLMPRLLDVPSFAGILIHWGNRPEDTDGCILVGLYNERVPDFVGESRKTFNRLFEALANHKEKEPWITVMGGIRTEQMAVA